MKIHKTEKNLSKSLFVSKNKPVPLKIHPWKTSFCRKIAIFWTKMMTNMGKENNVKVYWASTTHNRTVCLKFFIKNYSIFMTKNLKIPILWNIWISTPSDIWNSNMNRNLKMIISFLDRFRPKKYIFEWKIVASMNKNELRIFWASSTSSRVVSTNILIGFSTF